ncbi:MAG: hypothetical protein EAZ91_20875 [Cytophagales bacterium]|nr:MAG: hypothetical protein EAZ91_20875 [Cytophagales bacterium]
MYPSFSEYLQAIDLASDTLSKLRQLQPVRKADGQPYFSSGNFAVVFRMENPETGAWVALRCFLRDVPRRRERLQHIADYLRKNPSPYLLPIGYHPAELWVETRFGQSGEFDLMTMPWAEGQTLATYVAHCCEANDHRNAGRVALRQLAHRFDAMANWLLAQPFAHGDLKPDNIMVATDGTLRLIDYDGCYVPALHGLPSPELGSPPYRHPDRQPQQYDAHLDDFSLLLLSLELHALSHTSDLFSPMDSLIFEPTDLENPGASVRWQQVRQLPVPAIRARLALLEFAINAPVGPILSLRTLLARDAQMDMLGLIPYRQKGRWGFVNNNRQVIVACQYDDVGVFSEGLAMIRSGGKFGYVNQQGGLQIPLLYDEAREFSEGLAVVRSPNGYHHIDTTGQSLTPDRFAEAGMFQEGMALVRRNTGWGFLNTSGQLAVPGQFEAGWPFSGGLARIRQADSYGFIDRRGQVVIEGPFTYALNFSEGLAAVEQGDKFGFIDPRGEVVVPPTYDDAGNFSEGLALVQLHGRTGYIDRQGQVVIPLQYEPLLMGVLYPFSEGLALIKKGGKYGYINQAGEVVVPPTFDEGGNFSEGRALVCKEGKWGFINVGGQVIIPCSFDHAYSFRRGIARVRLDNRLFYIDRMGSGYVDE